MSREEELEKEVAALRDTLAIANAGCDGRDESIVALRDELTAVKKSLETMDVMWVRENVARLGAERDLATAEETVERLQVALGCVADERDAARALLARAADFLERIYRYEKGTAYEHDEDYWAPDYPAVLEALHAFLRRDDACGCFLVPGSEPFGHLPSCPGAVTKIVLTPEESEQVKRAQRDAAERDLAQARAALVAMDCACYGEHLCPRCAFLDQRRDDACLRCTTEMNVPHSRTCPARDEARRVCALEKQFGKCRGCPECSTWPDEARGAPEWPFPCPGCDECEGKK